MTEIPRKAIDDISKKLVDEGKIIEAGWNAMFALTLQGASKHQIIEMRKAYFAGAQHLFASIISILDPGSEPTDKDLERMTLINDELAAFVKELKEEHFT